MFRLLPRMLEEKKLLVLTCEIMDTILPKGKVFPWFIAEPYSELMRLTQMSSPFDGFDTSIFFDQLPDFNSTESLENEQRMPAMLSRLMFFLNNGGKAVCVLNLRLDETERKGKKF